MRFILRQKFLSFGDDFVIRNEHGHDCFIVDGRAFSIGDKLAIRNMEGKEVAFIAQKLLSWGPSYRIHRPGLPVTEVHKKHFTIFHCQYEVDGPGDEDYEASGDFLEHEYHFKRHGHLVAEVSKHWFAFTDTYGIDIAEGEDPVLLLATAVVIDLVCHADKDQKH